MTDYTKLCTFEAMTLEQRPLTSHWQLLKLLTATRSQVYTPLSYPQSGSTYTIHFYWSVLSDDFQPESQSSRLPVCNIISWLISVQRVRRYTYKGTIFEHDHSILGFTWAQLTSGVVNPVSTYMPVNVKTNVIFYLLSLILGTTS